MQHERSWASLVDILQASQNVQSFIEGKSFEAFEKDLQCQYAVTRGIEIIGEASKRVEIDFRDNYPQVPWKKMAGIRDMLIHVYEEADIEIIWKVAVFELPVLIEKIQAILETRSK